MKDIMHWPHVVGDKSVQITHDSDSSNVSTGMESLRSMVARLEIEVKQLRLEASSNLGGTASVCHGVDRC